MQWDRITSPEFAAAVKTSGGVCLLPMGVIEKHGNHLPLGQDSIYIHDVCSQAAEREPAMVFPYYYFGQIFEAQHLPGTIAIESDLLLMLLRNLCDEIARNGFPKIVLVNGHGGNNHMLRYFLQTTLEAELPYTVYASFFPGAGPRSRKLLEAKNDGHAGETETSAMLHLHPELVKLEAFKDYGKALGRTKELAEAGLETGIWWYADYPGHLQGDAVAFTAEKGEAIVADHVELLVRQIKAVKRDTSAPELFADFYSRLDTPSNRYP